MWRTQFLLVFVALYVGMVHSWDIATSSGDDLLSFYTNETLTRTVSIDSRKLYALTYDEVHNMMLYVDKQTNNDSMCGYDLTSAENKCFMERSGRNIHDLAFDPVTERVFFTDTIERSINWISLKPGFNNNINGHLFIKMDDGVPHDIAIDSCKGHVYWLNTNVVNPTIERVRIDGTEREVFETLSTIPVNAYYKLEPNSLTIDQHKQRIYWMAPVQTTEYRLFTRLLNTKHTPFGIICVFNPKNIKLPSNTLTVSKSSVLHLEYAYEVNSVYSYSKIKSNDIYYTDKLKSTIEKKTVYCDRKMPVSIVANYKIEDQVEDCEPLNGVKLASECDGPFCVHGTKVDGQSACICTPGYTGERCDMSVCENFCFQGNCSFNDDGRPQCRCDVGYTGQRCEVNQCQGYCLNHGECSLNEEEEPYCQCGPGYEGTRCETDTNKIPYTENNTQYFQTFQ